jgi:hypothetical protein
MVAIDCYTFGFVFVIPQCPSILKLFTVLLALVYTYAFLRTGIHYSIHEEYLLMRFWGIPLRKIPWIRVTTATFLHKWMDHRFTHSARSVRLHRDIVYGRMIYITLDQCPDYCPESQSRLMFSLRHPLTTCTLWIPYWQSSRVEELFAKYCHLYEKQPFEDE